MTRTAAQKEKAKEKATLRRKLRNKLKRGNRGKASREKAVAKQVQKYHKRIWGMRVDALKLRTASGFGSTIGPAIGVNEHRKLAKGVYSLCTNEYYAEYDFEKPLVEVRTSANVSNPEGLRGAVRRGYVLCHSTRWTLLRSRAPDAMNIESD